FQEWWTRIRATYNVRANVAVSGDVYKKYGTSFGTRVLVIDKNGPTVGEPVRVEVSSVGELIDALEGVRNERSPRGKQDTAGRGVPGEAAGSGTESRPSVPVPAATGGVGIGGDTDARPDGPGTGGTPAVGGEQS